MPCFLILQMLGCKVFKPWCIVTCLLQVLRGKPAPDVFQVALKRFNDPSAREESTLVFEDAWNGVQAGLAAGMFVVWVPEAFEGPGFPADAELAEEEKTRVIRLNSLEEFDPSLFGLPPY